jgi:uncharacterized membrane protein (DUF485 family)
MSNDKDSLVVYILGWIAVALTTAVSLGLFFGIVARVAGWVAG